MSGRIPCEGSGCHHTIGRERYVRQFKHEPGIWICPKCWAKVSAAIKRVKARHEREFRKFGFYPRPEAYARVWASIYKAIQP